MASWSSISSNSLLAAVSAAVLAFTAAGCRSAADLSACIPSGSTLIAGADLAQLRSSPLYAKLPETAKGFLAQFARVSTAVAAYNGADLLIAARGAFPPPPPGAVMLDSNIALFGSSDRIAAAAAQYKAGRSGAPELVARAEAVSAGKQLWVAARGNGPWPLTGNAANLARILRNADFVTLTVQLDSEVALDLRALAREENAARAIEETLRADLTLAAAGEAKHAGIARALGAAQVTRARSDVRVSLVLSTDDAARLFALL